MLVMNADKLAVGRWSKGFTLVELMVGLVVGLIAVGTITALYITVIRGAAFATAEARLIQETRIAMDFMAADIRRAGFSHPSHIESRNGRPPLNPFMTTETSPSGENFPDGVRDIRILNVGSSCVMLSYDPTYSYDPGIDADWPGDEGRQYVFGYRLIGNQLEMLSDPSGDVNSTADCSGSPPAPARWVPLTDPETTRIQDLSFDLVTECFAFSNSDDEVPCPETFSEGEVGIESRRVRIRLRGDHATNPDVSVSFDETVGVKNNRIFDQ